MTQHDIFLIMGIVCLVVGCILLYVFLTGCTSCHG